MNPLSANQEQKNVNAKGFEERITIQPSGYHRDRALNAIYGTSENLKMRSTNIGILPPTESFKNLIKYFKPDQPSPAGGWYLVKEQRDWLKESLVKIIEQSYAATNKKEIDILEAGVASFNHHFSYMVILNETLEELGIPDFKINLTVTDKAYYPLFCIDAINPSTFETLRKEKKLIVFDYEVPLMESFFDFIDEKNVLNFKNIKVRTKQYDLTDLINTAQLGQFDIITEHFITSVLDNFGFVKYIRKTYTQLLKDKGYLLDASGMTPHIHGDRFDEFLDLHEDLGLLLQSGRVNVWDPYGMKASNLMRLLDNESVDAHFDNGLFVFRKE